MIDVAMMSPLPPQKTGESEYSASLIAELALRQVHVLAIAGPEAHQLAYNGAETFPIWNGRQLTYPLRIASFLRRHRPHILHVQFGPDGAVYGGLWGEVMLILLIIARLMGIKTTVTLHSTWMPEQVTQRVRTYPRLRRFAIFGAALFRLYMRLLDWGTHTIQLSTVKIGSTLRKRFLDAYGISEEKVLEIPHPCKRIDRRIEPADARKQLRLERRDPLLIFGFIRRGKGIDIALRAMTQIVQRHPSSLLLVAGSPLGEDGAAYLREVQCLTQELGLDKAVRFDTEFIPSERVPLYFAASRIILLPYDESVGASGPAHNYAGYGVPIVAADVGLHMREALGGNIVLFKNRDSADLAIKVSDLLGDPERCLKIGTALRAYSLGEGWPVAAERTLKNYRVTLRK
ncbi:MAG: glycosyltransferase [Candidatus Thorarchaeota archaeon]